MIKMVAGSLGMLSLLAVSMVKPVLAAELLDVKPVITGTTFSIEVTADIPMTYTYYRVPGQARAVVDIADADPEKVEPLIVVNKGAISSISVDKTMLSDMTVSRLVFNLVAESDINVKQDPDRKKLTIFFGENKSVAVVEPVPTPSPVPDAVSAVVVTEPQKPMAAVVSPGKSLAKEEDDPLGLDETPNKPVVPSPAPTVARSVKPEPVIPVVVPSTSKIVVKGIVIGSSSIDVQTDGAVGKVKHMMLNQPDRLVIDIPGMSTMSVKSIAVNKYGIAKVRIGNSPGMVRIVLDAAKPPFPGYTVDAIENGVRINFK
jgi:type IV pilus assembly protein PilQ